MRPEELWFGIPTNVSQVSLASLLACRVTFDILPLFKTWAHNHPGLP